MLHGPPLKRERPRSRVLVGRLVLPSSTRSSSYSIAPRRRLSLPPLRVVRSVLALLL